MNFKKTIAGISALSMLLSASAVNAFAAEEEASNYTEKNINAYLYSAENVDTMTVRYYNDQPNVPYISFTEFYKKWVDQDLEITNNNDGTYEVKVPFGTVATIDVEKDTIHTDDTGTFFIPEEDANSSSSTNDLFTKSVEGDSKKVEITFDFGEYNIDLLGEDNDIWWPAPTLCDCFKGSDKETVYIADNMYFCGFLMSTYSRPVVTQNMDVLNYMAEHYMDGRPADLVKYNYNELCMFMDANYGYPGRMPFNDLMMEKGFDAMLEEGNDSTRKIKELLNSTDFFEYCAGIQLLNNYFFDGGHTSFVAQPYTADLNFDVYEGEVAAKINEIIESVGEMKDSVNIDSETKSSEESAKGIKAAREKILEDAENVEEFSTSLYYEKGDVAVLQFDTFLISLDDWDEYYHNNGELPEDVVTDFYKAVQKADSNPAIKKLVFDIASNGGGNMNAAMYMMNLIKGLDTASVEYCESLQKKTKDKNIESEKFLTDRNFDKAVDEKDDAIKFDLQYGVITSKLSYSCGNWFPSLCRDNDILIMGERSGGGSCAIDLGVLPDGIIFQYSTGITMIDANGDSIDLGIKPDYENVKVAEDGSKDFTEVYNFDNISKMFDEFYGNTTTPAETETTTTTTTTSATTSTTTSTETTTTTTSSATTTAEETTTTATTTKAEDKTIGTNDEIAKMVEKDYFVKTGKKAASSELSENKDGSVTVELKDADGKMIDKYTIDPETGKGTDANGEAVELPQTGINSLGTAGAAVGAVMLMLAGAAAVYGSGVIRKKEND